MSPSLSASVPVAPVETVPRGAPGAAAHAASQTPPRNIRRTVLPNGLLVLTESMPHVRSVSMGVWVNSGSRDETAPLNGMSHFVEHMVFKGTTTRSAQQIAREVDTIGGNLDAFTGKETICFNIKMLDENLTPALDVLTDLVLNPTFTPEDLAREQGVILEEIKMDEDNPDYLVHEVFTQNFWKNDALGRPILGTAETVSSFDQQAVFDYYRGQFTPENMVFSAAGNLDHDEFVGPGRAAVRVAEGRAGAAGEAACLRCDAAYYVEAEAFARTGAGLPGRSGASGERRAALWGVSAEHDAGRRDELAAVPDDPRG